MRKPLFSDILTLISIVLLISLANSLSDNTKNNYQSFTEKLSGVDYHKST